jgi:hypothetical protein
LEIIRDNAEFVVEFLKENNTPADYDASAIQWLEDYIEKRRDSFTSKQADLLIWTIGSFLGECMCRVYNGVWVERDGDWGVDMENGALVGSHSGK